MNGLCDLHVHSHCSDGTDSPSQLIAAAQRLGLEAVALCDHNTVAGLPEFMAAGAASSVRAVPGIEFSADYGSTELHILGLFIPQAHYRSVSEYVDGYLQLKVQSNLALAENLAKAGYPVDYAAICARTKGIPNRASFAAELVEMGCVGSIKEAIHTVLSPKNGLYMPPKHPQAREVIGLIKSLGAVAVLAHPFLNLKEPDLRSFLPEAITWGLDGMETLYSDFTPELTQKAIAIARELGLKQSGGSDYHGSVKPDIALGSGRGGLAVPISFLERLEAR